MTLSDYNPKLLNFLYELTKLDRPMSYREVANRIRIDGAKISAKSVERWFNFLKREYNHPKSKTKHKFDYFPKLYYEKLGMVYAYAIIDASKDFLEHLPAKNYRNYSAWLYDPSNNKNFLIVGYLIPLGLIEKFKSSWKASFSKGLVSYELHFLHTSKMVYSPLHSTVDGNGNQVFGNNPDLSKRVNETLAYFDSLPRTELCKEIKSNPFLIPVLFTSWGEFKSSFSVWKSLRKKFGSKIWDYANKPKNREEGYGVKLVQKSIRDLERFGISRYMKLIYLPLQLKNLFIYVSVDFDNQTELKRVLHEIYGVSLQSTVHLNLNKRNLFMINLVSGSNLPEVFSVLEKLKVKKLFFLQHEKSLPLLTSKHSVFDYQKVFDPISCSWKSFD